MHTCKHGYMPTQPTFTLAIEHTLIHTSEHRCIFHTYIYAFDHPCNDATMRQRIRASKNRAFMLSRLHAPFSMLRAMIHSRVSEHSCIHVSVHRYIRTLMLLCKRSCILCVHVHAFLQPCFRSALLSSNHAPIYTCKMVSYIHAYMLSSTHASMRGCVDASMHPCKHASMHSSINASICPIPCNSMRFNAIQCKSLQFNVVLLSFV